MENTGLHKKLHDFYGNPYFKIILAGILLFSGAAVFVPMAGVLRTLPFLTVIGIVLGILKVSVGLSCALCGVMTVCAYLLTGRGVVEAVLCTLAAEVLVVLGMYVSKLFAIAVRTENKSVKKKCLSFSALAVLASLVLTVAVCGNLYSFVRNNSINSKYINSCYDDTVQKRYTSYEALCGEYRTYVSFRDGDSVYGNDDSCHISVKNGVLTDGIRDFYESAMLEKANAGLASVISNATWGFNVASSDIEFEDGEILTPSSDVSDYMPRIGYVVCFDSIIGENEKDKFAPICRDAVYALKQSGFVYEYVVLCAGRADKVLFSFVVTPETEMSDVDGNIEEFDEKKLRHYSVSEEAILDYWLNK